MTAPVIFVDTETTGLDPDRHEVWDIALIEADGTEYEWHVKPDNFHSADEGALRITHFYERVRAAGYTEETVEDGYPERARPIKRTNFWTPETRGLVASTIVTLTANKHLVGAVPSFDARFLASFLRREGYVPAWHYQLVDVETLAVGALAAAGILLEPPWDSHEINRRLRLEGLDFGQKHTAIADARWAKAVYDRVMASEPTEDWGFTGPG